MRLEPSNWAEFKSFPSQIPDFRGRKSFWTFDPAEGKGQELILTVYCLFNRRQQIFLTHFAFHNQSRFGDLGYSDFFSVTGARSVIFCASSGRVVDNLVNGFAYYSSNCKPSTVSRQASDTHSCLEVLQKTMEILDLNPNYLDQLLNESRKTS